MEQTAITISMINNINNRNMNNDVQRMTSLEIAQLTGKPHSDVLKAIRKMEPAWENVCQGKFSLTSRTISQPNGGTRVVPCYSLTKTETLYIATKFNDEARARLVLRWCYTAASIFSIFFSSGSHSLEFTLSHKNLRL